MNDNEISTEEWLKLDSGFADILRNEWDRSFISLSAAVYWIATEGHAENAESVTNESLEDAARRLVAALQSSELTARGIANGNSIRSQIQIEAIEAATDRHVPFISDPVIHRDPHLTWNTTLDDDHGDLIEDRCEVHWRDVRVKKADIQRLWPQTDAVSEAVAKGAEYRTGYAGRPSSKNHVLAEAKRRRDSSEAFLALKDEAAHLSSWIAKEHPDAPPMAAGTVENHIGKDHMAWKDSLPRK